MQDVTEDVQILVVDDDARLRIAVRRGLALEGYRVLEAASGEEGLEKVRQHLPDLVVLDVMMPGMDGLEVARTLRSAGDGVAILVLTARDRVAERVEGLESGADDYMVKPFDFDELLARVRALLRRRMASSGEVLRFGDLELDLDIREARRRGRAIELSATEYSLLLLLMRHPRTVLPRAVMMEHVWEDDFAGATNVLDVYMRELGCKIGCGEEPGLIRAVRGTGYVLTD
jgi:two-component system response regulator MprA